MAWFCTSDNCKIMLLIFVVFLAGYFIAENDVAKRKRPISAGGTEHFESEYSPVDKKEDISIPTAEVEKILAKIDTVYKDVYGEPVPADKMSLYYKSLGAANFDEGSFKRRLSIERKTSYETLVKDVFMEVLKRLPTPTEQKKYMDLYLGNQMKTQQDLQFILRMDIESVVQSDSSDVPELPDKEDYNTYKDIISTFEDVLGRNPNTSELKFYYDLIKKNGYDQKKIKDILLSSREHEILIKNQNNQVHGDLSANITEKQLEMAVNEMYNAVFFEYPDAETYKFLRGKFVAMNLDEEKLAIFIKRLKSAESDVTKMTPTGTPARTSSTRTPTGNPSMTTAFPKIPPMSSAMTPTMTPAMTPAMNPTTTPAFLTVPPINPAMNPTMAPSFPTVPPMTPAMNSTMIPAMTPDMNPTMAPAFPTVPPMTPAMTPTMTPSTEMFDEKVTATPDISRRTTTMQLQNNNTTTLRPNSDDNTNIGETIDAIKCAKYFEKKYKGVVPEECKFNNKKTKHYLNADDNMVLRPEMSWQVPMRRSPVCYATDQVGYNPSVEQSALIGTLLPDAEKTSVGSIMPKFEYRNMM